LFWVIETKTLNQGFYVFFFTLLDGFNGVVQIDGEKWREQRRFSLHVLRDFGVGRALIEEKIMNQVDYLMEHLNSYSKTRKTLDLSGPLAVCVGNIINDVLFGKTFRHVGNF
jgi:hypothetical protein